MNLFAFPKLNGDYIMNNTDLQYEGNVVVITLFPMDMPMVERLLKAGPGDEFGVTIGASGNIIPLGLIHHAKLTKVDSAVEEATLLEITITLQR